MLLLVFSKVWVDLRVLYLCKRGFSRFYDYFLVMVHPSIHPSKGVSTVTIFKQEDMCKEKQGPIFQFQYGSIQFLQIYVLIE